MTHYGAKRPSHVPVALIVAAVVAVIVVPIVLVGPERRSEEPTEPAEPSVEAVAREIRTIPALAAEQKNALVGQLASALDDLYTRAFVATGPDPTPPPSPAPTPATRVDGLFTSKARAALRNKPEVFQRIPSLRVEKGRVAFAGVVTLEGSRPVQAYLEIAFDAEGRPEGSSSAVRLRQEGNLLLVGTNEGWRVDGFDLRFSSRPQTPTPQA